jgi:hypothetical protein
LVSDYRGIGKALKIPLSPAYYACFKCKHKGIRVGSKTIYANRGVWLPVTEVRRRKLLSKYNIISTKKGATKEAVHYMDGEALLTFCTQSVIIYSLSHSSGCNAQFHPATTLDLAGCSAFCAEG